MLRQLGVLGGLVSGSEIIRYTGQSPKRKNKTKKRAPPRARPILLAWPLSTARLHFTGSAVSSAYLERRGTGRGGTSAHRAKATRSSL